MVGSDPRPQVYPATVRAEPLDAMLSRSLSRNGLHDAHG